MTKTLTEQWKDMDLADEQLYYWRMPNGEVRIMSKMGVCSYKLCYDGDKIDILAPVPSQEEWKEISESEDQAHAHLQDEREKNMCLEESVRILEKKLAIAKRALNIYSAPTGVGSSAYIALREIEEVK